MDAARRARTHDAAAACEPAAEIDILQPSVQGKSFVEGNAACLDGAHAHRHVAAVAVVDVDQRLLFRPVPAMGSEEPAGLLDIEAGAEDAIGDDFAGHHGYIRMREEDSLDVFEIVREGQEVIVKEYNYVKAGAFLQNGVA